MNSFTQTSVDICELCASGGVTAARGTRCAACCSKGDLVGKVVWRLVREAVQSAPSGERVTFMLVGLRAVFLEGIARAAPPTLQGRSVLLRINPQAAENLSVDRGLMSEESAVHWRHSAAADVIVFAPSDEEREGIGAGLGPISRIDDEAIVAYTEAWLEHLDGTPEQLDWLANMLGGLRAVAMHADLEMWADFILALRTEGAGDPVDIRVKNAVPALRLPRAGVLKLPRWKADGMQIPNIHIFRSAFQAARDEVRPYAALMTPKQEPVDLQAVRLAVETYDAQGDEEMQRALQATSDLLDDEPNIRPGEWRQSQRAFCETVSWERIGAELFKGGQKARAQSLGDQTRRFIEDNYQTEVTAEDRALLETLPNAAPSEPKEEEIEFFGRWQERLSHPTMVKSYKAWQKRLFSGEVIGHDLVTTFSEAFQALIIAGGETLANLKSPRVLVRAAQHDKALYWEGRNHAVLQLFRFELRSLQGLVGRSVKLDLEKCFLHDGDTDHATNEARKVDLEFYLLEAEDLADLESLGQALRRAPRVKATWQPGGKPKDVPISLALTDDIAALAKAADSGAGLFRKLTFAPRSSGDESRIAATTLSDTTTFNDVNESQEGRAFDILARPKDDQLAELRRAVETLRAKHILSPDAADAILTALDTFAELFAETVQLLAVDPTVAFAGEEIPEMAEAFGRLCEACRTHATAERARLEIRPIVTGLGVLQSAGAEPMAILAAWHPLRLAERRAKLAEFAQFVENVLSSEEARNADLGIVFEERKSLLTRWVFPEAVVVGTVTMVSVEDMAGYSLLVPADCVARSQEALENAAPAAAKSFIDGVGQFLDVHPHEATNLSAAIYDSESLSLPQEIAKLLAQRLRSDPDLRCDLVITHHDQDRMRSIYRNQNTRLAAENISDTAKGFLSRLRVDVKPNRASAGAAGQVVHDLDLVFLHETINHYASTTWDHEAGDSSEFATDFLDAIGPVSRRRLAEADALGVAVYLSHPTPPRAVGAYYDLLYEMAKEAVLPAGQHGVLIRQVQFSDERVQDLIRAAHDLGHWVVSCDKVANRNMLEAAGIQVIRDVSLPGSEGRVILSSKDIDGHLKRKLIETMMRACDLTEAAAQGFADAVLADVRQISGQKLLGAARISNAAQEMIGLSLMRSILEASLPSDLPEASRPIWISLDDYRSWFTKGKGKVADAVGLTIADTGEGFDIYLQVGEAKFVGDANAFAESREACIQVRDSLEHLQRIFVDNPDRISRASWCGRLVDLLINRNGLAERLPDPQRRALFLSKLREGDVAFKLSGEAVIAVHDDHSQLTSVELDDPERPYLRKHHIPTPEIRRILESVKAGSALERAALREVCWLPDGDVGTAQGNGAGAAHAPTAPAEAAQDPTAVLVAQSVEATAKAAPIGSDAGRASDDETPEEVPQDTAAPAEGAAVDDTPFPRFLPKPFAAVLQELAATEGSTINDEDSRAWAIDVAKRTQQALSSYGMRAHFADDEPRLTPNGALIAFAGHDTLTVDKIEKRLTQLLTTHGVEVVDVRPGPGRISLFVKRPKRATVPLGSTWLNATWPDRDPGEMASFILGAREDDDSLLYLNLGSSFGGLETHAPHTLLAGETGSGKGILTQGLLLQLIAFNDPARAELILVDPKQGVDFAWIEGAPQLRQPILTSVEEATAALEALVCEMDDRYRLFGEVKAPNITSYNAKVPAEKRLSRIFMVHDELGAWMAGEKAYQDVVLSAVANLGMKARAAGIHLTLITQRADADAVPPKLRDNMGNRLCLRVQNATGSRMVLGFGGAQKLLGKGHLAAILGNQSAPPGQEFFTLQVPYADEDAMQRLADAAISYWQSKQPQ